MGCKSEPGAAQTVAARPYHASRLRPTTCLLLANCETATFWPASPASGAAQVSPERGYCRAVDLTAPQQVTIQVFGQPTYGADAAGGLRLTLYDSKSNVIATVP